MVVAIDSFMNTGEGERAGVEPMTTGVVEQGREFACVVGRVRGGVPSMGDMERMREKPGCTGDVGRMRDEPVLMGEMERARDEPFPTGEIEPMREPARPVVAREGPTSIGAASHNMGDSDRS